MKYDERMIVTKT